MILVHKKDFRIRSFKDDKAARDAFNDYNSGLMIFQVLASKNTDRLVVDTDRIIAHHGIRLLCMFRENSSGWIAFPEAYIELKGPECEHDFIFSALSKRDWCRKCGKFKAKAPIATVN